LTIHVANTSGKDITAYNLSVTEKYTDGTSNFSERSQDFMGALVAGLPVFTSGSTRQDVIHETKDVLDVTATVDVVAYSDLTADVSNNRAFARLMTSRKGNVLALQKSNEVIERMLADPNVSDPGKSSADEIERLVTVLSAKPSTSPDDPQGYERGTLNHIARELRRTASASGNRSQAESLKAMVIRHQDHIAKMTQHTQLQTGGVGQ
jgi:hypothetical protein